MMSTDIKRSQTAFRVLHLALPWLALSLLVATANADSRTRHYDFEEGTANSTTNTVEDKLDVHLVPAFGDFFGFDHYVPETIPGLGVPQGEPVKTWIDNNVDSTPPLTIAEGATTGATFVASDSPAPGSTIAVQFDGGSQALQGRAFRDSYVLQSAYDSDAPAVNGDTVDNTFFIFSQAWVYPSSAGQGTQQVVWAIGEENGGVQITGDGFWQLASVGGATLGLPAVPVAFDEWSHVAVARGGGSGTLYVNGSVAATASGSFGRWGDSVTLGADEDLELLFNGKVDNFDVGGLHDGSFVAFEDLAFFGDLGLPQPTDVLGDVDQDGDADQDDYAVWSMNAGFNNSFGVGDVTTLVKGDLNNDGRVDFFDFTEIATAVAAGGGSLDLSGGVPEPHSLMLAALGALACWVRRKQRTTAN
jgi:hypothetical protein